MCVCERESAHECVRPVYVRVCAVVGGRDSLTPWWSRELSSSETGVKHCVDIYAPRKVFAFDSSRALRTWVTFRALPQSSGRRAGSRHPIVTLCLRAQL